jgi:hypothetical protein
LVRFIFKFKVIFSLGSGKTKFICDLAFVKREYVIFIDWKAYGTLFSDIETRLASVQRTFYARKLVFEDILNRLMYLGSLILERGIVHDPMQFFYFWISSPEKVSRTLSRIDKNAARGNVDFIFAFDECQLLLQHEDGIDCGSRRVTPSFFSYLFEALALYNNNRVVFSGTSLRISVMLEQLSPTRKQLFVPKYPPLFHSSTVQKYLAKFHVDNDTISKVKDSLIGRPLCSRYFVEVYRSRENTRPYILLREVSEMLRAHFTQHMKEYASAKAWLDFTVGNGRSRRSLLIDLMSNGEIAFIPDTEKYITDFAESVNSALLPIYRVEETFRYRSHDLLAFHVLLDILNENEGNLSKIYANLNADRMFHLAMEKKRISGEVGEFIMENVILSIKSKKLSESALFQKLQQYPEYGDAFVQISKVNREENGYKSVLRDMDFETLCVSCDLMARFDFMCLLKNEHHKSVIAVFGGAKLYGSNLSPETFWDNVQSCDPDKAFLKLNEEPTSKLKRDSFVLLWQTLAESVHNAGMELRVLMIAFAYPHPVGSMKYKDFMERGPNKLVYFIGHEKLHELKQVFPQAAGLIAACTGTENPTKRRNLKTQLTLEESEKRFLKKYKKKQTDCMSSSLGGLSEEKK